MLIGCIADDFTGASDLGNMLALAGMSTTLCIGVPPKDARIETDAAVVALKTRSVPAAEAVKTSLEALDWMRACDVAQVYFKYCSTFDSTPEGNIGPVLDALAEALNAPRAVVVPSFPGAGRRVFMGHLFVQDQLLNRSGMEDHPLTPMTESDIRRWLALQTKEGVGHVDASAVRAGAQAVRAALEAETAAGRRYVVVDTMDDDDLRSIGAAVAGDVLVSGGSGLGLGLPANFDEGQAATPKPWRGKTGRAVAFAGSCSRATQAQVSKHGESQPLLRLDPFAVAEGSQSAETAAQWVQEQPADAVPMVSSTMSSEKLAEIQSALGRERSAEMLESLFGELAAKLVDAGYERVIVGGGETSGAVVSALDVAQAEIGPQIAPGVPALAPKDAPFVCTLKSGNFGDEEFFMKAASVLAGGAAS